MNQTDKLNSLRVQVSELYSQVSELYAQTQALSRLVRMLLDREGLHKENALATLSFYTLQIAAESLLQDLPSANWVRPVK